MEKEEYTVEIMRSQLVDIQGAIHEIEKDMKVEIGKFSVQFHEFSIVISSVLVKLEERDRRFYELITDNKETFTRFGNEISDIHKKMHEVEMTTQKVDYLEKLIYGTATATGGLLIWFIQKALRL